MRLDLSAYDCIHVVGGRNRRKLHTFAFAPVGPLADGTEGYMWTVASPLSHKDAADYDRQYQAMLEEVRRRRPELLVLLEEARPRLRRRAGEATFQGQPLRFTTRVDLGEGVTVSGRVLRVVLNALRQDGRAEVHRDDLKIVFSQMGSRIKHHDAVWGEENAGALYNDILRRCTRV